jgi:hypothetical protein
LGLRRRAGKPQRGGRDCDPIRMTGDTSHAFPPRYRSFLPTEIGTTPRTNQPAGRQLIAGA